MMKHILAAIAIATLTGCPPKMVYSPDAHGRIEPPAPGVVLAYTVPPSP